MWCTIIVPIFQKRKLRFRVVEWLAWDRTGGKWLREFGNCHQPMKMLLNILRENWSFWFFKSLDLLIHKPFTKEQLKCAQSCPTICDHMEPTRLLHPWNSPGKNTGMGCHFLLQGIFPTWGSNPSLFLGRWIFYHWVTWCQVVSAYSLKYTIRIKDNLSLTWSLWLAEGVRICVWLPVKYSWSIEIWPLPLGNWKWTLKHF